MLLHPSHSVAEIQGYYGSLTIAEKVLQEIWRKKDFELSHLETVDGKPVEILEVGAFNQLDGPDFKGGKFLIDGKPCYGDVEMHLYPIDWKRHGHGRDRNYDQVMLHVTLFDTPHQVHSEPEHRLVLLPYLKEDLESILTRYLIDSSEVGLHEWIDRFLAIEDSKKQSDLLLEKAMIRWHQKVAYAQSRLDRFGWDQSCHQILMEVLGYHRNRAPMSELAMEYPLNLEGVIWDADELFRSKADQWKLSGSRPANHPRTRLEAYASVLRNNRNWPEQLRILMSAVLRRGEGETSAFSPEHMSRLRKELGIKSLLDIVQKDVLGDEIRGSRINTLMCDGFLPLLSAALKSDLFEHWYLWPSGDIPDFFNQAIRRSLVAHLRGSTRCNGWNQGLIQLGLESD